MIRVPKEVEDLMDIMATRFAANDNNWFTDAASFKEGAVYGYLLATGLTSDSITPENGFGALAE